MKTNYPYPSDRLKVDLRNNALKAYDYINYLAREAGANNERFVRNALALVRVFNYDQRLIQNQVEQVERRLSGRIEQNRRGQNNLPPAEIFRNGVINTGKIVGTNIDAKLGIGHFSGNMTVYGQYGMGKTELNLSIIPQIISQGTHVDIFDITTDYRDILQIPHCAGGLVLNPNNDKLNVLEPIGDPKEHLQFLWEITGQDFNLRTETREMLFNYSNQLYSIYGVFEGKNPPSLIDLKNFLEEEKNKSRTTAADKKKIETALSKLTYILGSFKNMLDCKRGYSLDYLDKFSFVSYETGNLSEDKRSWHIKLKLRQYYHKGITGMERHKVLRIIVIDEAKGILGKSRIGDTTNYIKDMFTKSRPVGCGWITSDQFATGMANFTRAANCQVCFQHTVPVEIREIAVSMGCDESQKLLIPRLGKHRALQKIPEFPFPYLITTNKSLVRRHIGDDELNRLMQNKLAGLNYIPGSGRTEKRVRLIVKTEINRNNQIHRENSKAAAAQPGKNILEDLQRFLRYVKDNPGTKTTDIYRALRLSGRRGDSLKTKAKNSQLIAERIRHTGKKGRPQVTLELTTKGENYANEEPTP